MPKKSAKQKLEEYIRKKAENKNDLAKQGITDDKSR